MRLQLRIKVGDEVLPDWLIMLAKLFKVRYVRPYHIATSDPENPYSRVVTNYVHIEIDGAQELTPEHWQYIKDEEYTLRFVEPSPELLVEEEDG